MENMTNEIWMTVDGYPLYEVSNSGRVRSWNGRGAWSGKRMGEPRYLKGTIKEGRHNVSLGRNKHLKVSRLVCAAFHGPCPDGMECCHNNGKSRDNRASNLRWDTHVANIADKIKHGTHRRGETHSSAKLTEKNVEQIIQDAKSGESCRSLGARFGVSHQQVSRILNGKRWSWKKVS